MHLNATTITRFWKYVAKSPDPDGCWLWIGATRRGYGVLNLNGPLGLAHRISWHIHYGPIPDGLLVCHHCDVRGCVRPDHLFLGTSMDNVRDAEAKGRMNHACGDRSGARTHPERLARGERVGCAKLTAPEVIEMRRRYDAGEATASALAREFHVTATNVCAIVHHKRWTHIP